jgi:hypothetical protein
VVALQNAPFKMPGHRVELLEVALKKREALVYGDLHYVSNLFSPHLIHDMELRNDQHAMAGFMRVFCKNSLIRTKSSKS